MEVLARSEKNWLTVLHDECKKRNQRVVATELGYSQSVINQVLKGTYGGDNDKVRAKVEGLYMGATVMCPVVGAIPRNRCIEQQGRPFAATNPMRVQMYRTCPTCPNNQSLQHLTDEDTV